MGLVVPLVELVQTAAESDHASCNTKPGVFGVHEIEALPGVAEIILSVGAPATWTAVGKTQKPPVTENCPFVIGPPASG